MMPPLKSHPDTGNAKGRILCTAAVLPLLLVFFACQSTPPDDGIQVMVNGWPGNPGSETKEVIFVHGTDLQVGLDETGALAFTPGNKGVRVEFPDASVIEAENLRLTLSPAADNPDVGVGPHNADIRLIGRVLLQGPFSPAMKASAGTPERGLESIPLDSGMYEGPITISFPADLLAVMATGRAMVFGSLGAAISRPGKDAGEAPEEPDEEPGDAPDDDTAPPEEPADASGSTE